MLDFDTIDDKTGFARGEKFTTEEQVHDYFQTETIEDAYSGQKHLMPTQAELDEMAQVVIVEGYHCEFRGE